MDTKRWPRAPDAMGINGKPDGEKANASSIGKKRQDSKYTKSPSQFYFNKQTKADQVGFSEPRGSLMDAS